VGEAVVEIGRALQFFMTSTAYSRVDKVYLAGGGATLPGMVEALAQGLGQDVEPFSPFDGMTIAPQVSRAALSRDACVLGVACGLALRRFDSERAL
jgi:type IV pilus assembly protein PilM